MKRYLLFAGDNYYPSGGMYDFVFSSDDINSLKAIVLKVNYSFVNNIKTYDVVGPYKTLNINGKEMGCSGAWAHIYDTSEMKIIWETTN